VTTADSLTSLCDISFLMLLGAAIKKLQSIENRHVEGAPTGARLSEQASRIRRMDTTSTDGSISLTLIRLDAIAEISGGANRR
jgi:hypothetical protein